MFELPKRERTLARLLDEIYVYYAEKKKPEAVRWGDKTPRNTYSLHWINRVYPNCQFVHILRDPRDVVNSYLKAGLYQDLNAAAYRWLESITEIDHFKRKIPANRCIEIRYEELVRFPEKKTKELCAFLGLEYNPGMLHFSESVNEMGDTAYEHHQNLYRPVNPNSIGKWKRQLTKRQVEEIESICGEKMRKFSYL